MLTEDKHTLANIGKLVLAGLILTVALVFVAALLT